ncbi:MAG: DNA polymerase I [Raoultibacter sp.]
MSKKIAVIDGNSLMHRAYHAVPPSMNAPDGTPTNAVFGFMSMLLKFIETSHPTAIICAFDAGRPAFRMEALKEYKAQRPPMDDDLKVQFPLIETLLQSMNIPVVRIKGWEGDDILGTVAARDEALGYETLLVTGDKDAYQLASKLTQIVTTKKGITDVALYGPEQVFERYGVHPEQVPDFLGLKGDPSDNIPGVPGIGEKTAAKLLQAYGTLEGLYENLDKLKGKQLENVRNNKHEAFASRKVATIVKDLDFPLDLEGVHFPDFKEDHVTEGFQKLRFNAHLAKVLALIGKEAVRAEARVEVGAVVQGKEAFDFISSALVSDQVLGVAFEKTAQASLFESSIRIAVNAGATTALFAGDEAQRLLARIVREGTFVTLEAKRLLQVVYPPDTAQEALISDSELFGARLFDLSLAGYVLNSSTPEYTLDTLLDSYCGGGLPDAQGNQEVLVLQAVATSELREPLRDALREEGALEAYESIDAPLVAVLTAIERTGAALDVHRLAELSTLTAEKLEDTRTKIYELAGEEFNIDSPRQLGRILFEVIGLTPLKKNQRGYSTDASVLRELSSRHELPALILHYRELAKMKSTYLDALPRMCGDDGRVHTTFNETVTTTGRLSSSEPNLQNIPVRTSFGRQIRECFVPLVAGDKFLSADYSQIELRLLAHLSMDKGLIEAFRSGADFHAQTASRVFGLPVDEITPELRSRAKAVNFGIVYGQQAYGLAQSLGISFGEAKEMIDRYFSAYPGVRTYLDRTVEDARQAGFATTMFGRKRHIAEIKSANGNTRAFGERTAMNHPMQGSAADIIKLAMTEVARRMLVEGFNAKLLLQVHDELDFSVPADEIDQVSAMVKDVMENVVQLHVPLDVSISFGDNWAEAH